MKRKPLMKQLAAAALLGAVAFLAQSVAQEATPAAAPTWIKAGFARPSDGKVAEGTMDGAFGGTIYYAVYELAAGRENTSDPYNTGVADFAQNFVAGGGSGAIKSPFTLTSEKARPKFLYLYQIVNDRGIEQVSKEGVKIATGFDVRARDIGSLVLRLPAEPTAIHSWGHFKKVGFALNTYDRGRAGEARPGTAIPAVSMAVSANPSILTKIREHSRTGHAQLSPPYEYKANHGFALARANAALAESYFVAQVKGSADKLGAWEKEALAASNSDPAAPGVVELLKFSDNDPKAPGVVLRASFADSPVKSGQHSAVVGFTSNLPPFFDAARLQDVALAKKGGDSIRTTNVESADFGAGAIVPLPKGAGMTTPEVAFSTGGKKPANIVRHGFTHPGDILSNNRKLVDEGSYRVFGGTVYFAVFRKVGGAGDTWGTGRTDMDGLFVPGESYKATVSPRLDTEAEYLYLYQVVNDRGFHDLALPANRDATRLATTRDKTPATREVASFSLFLKADPRLITSWGYFDGAGFNVSVANEAAQKALVEDRLKMAASSNLSVRDTLFGESDKVYRNWAPANPFDFSKTTLSLGGEMVNVDKNAVRGAEQPSTAALRQQAVKTLKKNEKAGGNRPDYAQLVYFAKAGVPSELVIDGITLGDAEVARAVFKVEWLNKPIDEGQHSVAFGFTSNAPPIDSPVRLKDLEATLNTSSEAQERVFLSPERIKAIALASLGQGEGEAPVVGLAGGLRGLGVDLGSAEAVAAAIAGGKATGIVPASIAALAAGSAANGVGLSGSLPSPADGAVPVEAAALDNAGAAGAGTAAMFAPNSGFSSGGIGGGFGGGAGTGNGLGQTRAGGSGGGGGLFGGGGGTSNRTNDNPPPGGGGDNPVVPAPASLLLGLLGLPGLAVVYRRRQAKKAEAEKTLETPVQG